MGRWGQEDEQRELVPIPLRVQQQAIPIQPRYFEADARSSNALSSELSDKGCKSPRNHHVNGDGRVVCDADPQKRLCFFYNRENRAGTVKECPIGLPDRSFDQIAENIAST